MLLCSIKNARTMCKETRVFDLLTVYSQKWPEQTVALAKKENATWKEYSPREYQVLANMVSYALMESGINAGDKVALIGESCPEWNIMDMGILQIGAITVPIDPRVNEEQCRSILRHSDAKMVISKDGVSYEKLIALGRQHPNEDSLKRRREAVKPEDCATIVYTLDVTDEPKGVMLSHSNIMHQLYSLRNLPASWSKVAFSFLPVSDTYERILVYLYQYLGMSVYYPESANSLVADMREIQPNMMSVVPSLLDSLHSMIVKIAETRKGLKGKIYRWALNLAERYKIDPLERSWWYNCGLRIADKLVYKRIRTELGAEHFDLMVSDDESLPSKTAAVFSAMKMPVYEGYGITEASPIIAVSNNKPYGREEGTVGPALPGVEIKVTPNGEICCRGHNVMMGYYKNKELTNKVIDIEGWLHTGDLGYINEYGHVCITKRLKNLIRRKIVLPNFQNIVQPMFT